MTAPLTLPALLASLAQSLALAQEATPRLAAIEHPADGISLLDVKNELLLSYLQNLVFFILLKLRTLRNASSGRNVDEAVRAKLVELRLFVEKGAWPLEEKLRFSIERFLRTAQDAERGEQRTHQAKKANRAKVSPSRRSPATDSDAEDDEENQESDVSDQTLAARRRPEGQCAAPRVGALIDDVTAEPASREDGPPGIYRPPKRERQVMETARSREKADRKPNKSHTMEEFINSELSAAPLVEPSIGTTIVQGGRKMKTVQECKEEAERREYEETNLVRLPKLSKKERAQKKEAGRGGHMQFGGEEWRDLGEGVDRIDRLTKRKGSAGGGVRALLEKSRKRGLDTTDGPRASGHGRDIGERFQKKVKMLDVGRRGRNR